MQWDNEHCRIIWRILVCMRHFIKVDFDPIIITSFLLLQKYFQNRKDAKYKLYILSITSFLISTKNNEIRCDIRDAFKSFIFSAQSFIKIFGENYLSNILELPNLKERDSISNEELTSITNCEIEMVDALNYIFDIDSPFTHLQKHVFPFLKEEIHGDSKKKLESITVAFIPCNEYFEFPAELIAASSAMITFQLYKVTPPPEVKQWISEVKSHHTSTTFQKIQSLFKSQMTLLNNIPNHPNSG